MANALPLYQKASSDHDDTNGLDPAAIAHMVNPRKDPRDTLHALLAVYVHRPGID
ncbi:hypothetical protein ACWAT4_14765 [Bradyrhizobium manausense]